MAYGRVNIASGKGSLSSLKTIQTTEIGSIVGADKYKVQFFCYRTKTKVIETDKNIYNLYTFDDKFIKKWDTSNYYYTKPQFHPTGFMELDKHIVIDLSNGLKVHEYSREQSRLILNDNLDYLEYIDSTSRKVTKFLFDKYENEIDSLPRGTNLVGFDLGFIDNSTYIYYNSLENNYLIEFPVKGGYNYIFNVDYGGIPIL